MNAGPGGAVFFLQLFPAGAKGCTRTRLRLEVHSVDAVAARLSMLDIDSSIDAFDVLRVTDPNGIGVYAIQHR